VTDVRLLINRYFSLKEHEGCCNDEGVCVGLCWHESSALIFRQNSVTNDCLYNKHI